MTEQEKNEIIDEVEKRLEQKYKGCLSREDTATVLKEVRDKWFKYDKFNGKPESPMHKIFGNIIYWQVWELIRKLTCVICGCQYVRHLAGCEYAEEVADRLCQLVYEMKIEYADRPFHSYSQEKEADNG